jgi:hypothetical protein
MIIETSNLMTVKPWIDWSKLLIPARITSYDDATLKSKALAVKRVQRWRGNNPDEYKAANKRDAQRAKERP